MIAAGAPESVRDWISGLANWAESYLNVPPAEFAGIARASTYTVWHWRAGKSQPSTAHVARLCLELGKRSRERGDHMPDAVELLEEYAEAVRNDLQGRI